MKTNQSSLSIISICHDCDAMLCRFNPIAPTLMKRALQNLLSSHLRLKGLKPPSKELLDLIVETSNGDIRSAVMALQFACTSSSASASSSNVPSKSTGKGRSKKEAKGGKGREESARWVEVMSRREQSLVLFHLLGKVLYNKRAFHRASPSQHLSRLSSIRIFHLNFSVS